MNEAKICSCGATMKSLGVKYLSISNTRVLAGSVWMQEDVEVFLCPECRRLEFYSLEQRIGESENEQNLYEMYKNESPDKLRKMLDSRNVTDECKTVIKKILSE